VSAAELLGWPEDDPTLRLDHREFAYAGKFVMSKTGKAVAREDGAVAAAVAFDPDATDPETLVVRYVTTRQDRQGSGVGARLLAFVVARARDRGFGRVRIGVNNPFSYHAAWKAGFGYDGGTTGLAELVCATDAARTTETYQAGLDAFREREGLDPTEESFLEAKAGADPPTVVDPLDASRDA
jgi:GNAT superfamily N-acetyltransferase